MPKVSIIMPSLNVANYISECMDTGTAPAAIASACVILCPSHSEQLIITSWRFQKSGIHALSITHQTLSDIEILCIDAGSTDGTLDILRDYESKDPYIHIHISHSVCVHIIRHFCIIHILHMIFQKIAHQAFLIIV